MGLLDAIDRVLGTRIGLLVSDPRAAVNALESDARAFNQASLLATQAERNAARGLPVSPEQLAAKQYIDRKNEEMALGFAGTINPKNTILGYRGTTYGEMMSNKPFTHFSKDPNIANQYAGWIDPKILSDVGIDVAKLPITEGAAVFPAKIKIKNPASIEDVKKFAPNVSNVQESFEILKKQGFDGYIDNYQVVPFNVKQIKSVFHK